MSKTKNKFSFGFDFYSPPKMERLLIPPKQYKIVKGDITCFIETEAKKKAYVPSPNLYST